MYWGMFRLDGGDWASLNLLSDPEFDFQYKTKMAPAPFDKTNIRGSYYA